MTTLRTIAICVLLLPGGCCRLPASSAPPSPIMLLDLSVLDEDGLRGPPDGKVAVSYEFCIPNTGRHRAEVLRIDHTIQFMGSSPGRIGCSDDECLCIGSTHQPNYRQVLSRIADLPYVTEIRRCDFE